VVFSPVWVETPRPVCGWYLDGGIRLNVPIKPAIALGAERVVVIATDPYIIAPQPPCTERRRPDIYAAVAEIMQATLVDRMIEDLRTLGKINELLLRHGDHPEPARSPSSRRLHRLVPYLFVGPCHQGRLGSLANHVVDLKYGHGRWLRNGIAFPLLNRLLDGGGKVRGELLSYLFFEHCFIEAAIKMGQRDARRLMGHDTPVVPWQLTS
jgi:NTE family protein